MERIAGVIEAALEGAPRLDAVAFTRGPGLAGALLVGKVAAQTLARARSLPLIGVNHVEAHALAVLLDHPRLSPFLALIASGGHTDLVWVRSPGRYRVLGGTRDDAAGEVFDKVAKLLRLGYPGGPRVARLARSGRPGAFPLPRPLLPGTWDFSFSGLKTAVLYTLRDSGLKPPCPRAFAADLCASFQEAVVDTLVEKTLSAARRLGARRVAVGGGVAANERLREKFRLAAGREFRVFFPPPSLCTDNAAMIAFAGALRSGRPARRGDLSVDPSLPVRSWA
jgi:N6-L-threonylcarbamoyladenine synthase